MTRKWRKIGLIAMLGAMVFSAGKVASATTFQEALAAVDDDKYLQVGDEQETNWSITVVFAGPIYQYPPSGSPNYVWIHFRNDPLSKFFEIAYCDGSIVRKRSELESGAGTLGPLYWSDYQPIDRVVISQKQYASAGVVYLDAVTYGTFDGEFYADYGVHTGLVTAFPDNTPPVANAGGDVTIQSAAQAVTVLQGTASDADGDSLQYRWLEGAVELMAWAAVVDGAAPLDLGALLPPLALGPHTLTLEVTDSQATSSASMTLTIDNSLPYVQPTATSVTVTLGGAISIGAAVADFDGDTVSYAWWKGVDMLASGSVQPPAGGSPVEIPLLTGTAGIAPFGLGINQLVIAVNDGVNSEQSVAVSVEVLDATAPTLCPVPSETMLWPPNNELRSVTIRTNASDDSGGPVTLTATVSSNEIDDGDCFVDSIDSETGTIALRLRAERSGSGEGRVYTITITATDSSSNVSTATVEISVPHDRRKK